jgi:hypothetical protein
MARTRFRLRLIFQEVDLWPGTFTIGRSYACNLTIEDLKVSREHARLAVGETEAHIADMGSRNGTTVNGEPLTVERRLRSGDRIRLGDYEFVFMEDKSAAADVERPTLRTISCPDCGYLYPFDEQACPSCGKRRAHDREAPSPEAMRTSPKLASTSSIRRRSNMIDEVINMALTMEHFDKAAELVDEKIGMLEKRGLDGGTDLDILEDLSQLNLMLAKTLEDGNRIAWVLDAWARAKAQLTDPVISSIAISAQGWYPLSPDISRYLSRLERDTRDGASPKLLERLRALI